MLILIKCPNHSVSAQRQDNTTQQEVTRTTKIAFWSPNRPTLHSPEIPRYQLIKRIFLRFPIIWIDTSNAHISRIRFAGLIRRNQRRACQIRAAQQLLGIFCSLQANTSRVVAQHLGRLPEDARDGAVVTAGAAQLGDVARLGEETSTWG
jgi:hypothetical protein